MADHKFRIHPWSWRVPRTLGGIPRTVLDSEFCKQEPRLCRGPPLSVCEVCPGVGAREQRADRSDRDIAQGVDSRVDVRQQTPQTRTSSPTPPMPSAHRLMRHPPTAQLLEDLCLTPHRHLSRPLPIDTQPEGPGGGEGQIDQFDFQLLTSLEVVNDQTIVRFGTGHVPFYRPMANNASQKPRIVVHQKMNSPAYNISSTSR